MAKYDKGVKNMEKVLDKLLERGLAILEKSDAFEKVVLKAHEIWSNASQKQTSTTMVEPVEPKVVEVEKIIEKIVEKPIEKIVEKTVEKEVKIPVTPKWAKGLEQQYNLWKKLEKFPKLHNVFEQTTFQQESEDVLRFISCASQWDNTMRLWERLAEQCKASKEPISEDELAFLENNIKLYNLTLNSYQATLKSPEIGTSYDYQEHMKISHDGETIQEVLLPALYDSAGTLVKKPLVMCV